MSHTYSAGKDTHFISNSDLSGDVTISHKGVEFDVPGWALLHFVADFVRREKMSDLECQSPGETLGVRMPSE